MTYDNALPCPTFNLDAGEAAEPPSGAAPSTADCVTIARSELERLLALVAEIQAWQADYERLKEKERVELLEPLPSFLLAPNHRIPRLAGER